MEIMEGKTLTEMGLGDWLYLLAMIPLVGVFVLGVVLVCALIFVGPKGMVLWLLKTVAYIGAAVGAFAFLDSKRKSGEEDKKRVCLKESRQNKCEA